MSTPPRLLLVEDEPNIRLALKFQLQEMCRKAFPASRENEPSIDEARNVDEAIRKIESSTHGYDLAVVDLRLPTREGIDLNGGFDVLDSLSEKFPDSATKRIVVSVRTDADAVAVAKKMGAEYLPKPWDKSCLERVVVNHLFENQDVATSEQTQDTAAKQ